MSAIGDRKLVQPEIVDEGVVMIPFAFQINATSDPNNVQGDEVSGRVVTRTSAGLFTFTLVDKAYSVIGGGVTCTSGATEDIVPHLDPTLVPTTGVVTVRTMTAGTPTDPADDNFVYGHLLVKKTDRRAGTA